MKDEAREPILRTERLTMRFGGLAALSELDLEVRAGDIHAIIGPNGAGKTTVFNCVTQNLRYPAARSGFAASGWTDLRPTGSPRPASAAPIRTSGSFGTSARSRTYWSACIFISDRTGGARFFIRRDAARRTARARGGARTPGFRRAQGARRCPRAQSRLRRSEAPRIGRPWRPGRSSCCSTSRPPG